MEVVGMLAVVLDYWTLTLAACAGLGVGWLVVGVWYARRAAQTRAMRAHLTDGSLSPRPQHTTFSQSTLRALAADDPEELVVALSGPGAEELLVDLWHEIGRDAASRDPDLTPLPPTGLEAIPARLAGRPAALVKLPEPRAATEAHFVAVVLNHELADAPKAAPAREFYYFLLEKSVADASGGGTTFAEWDEGAAGRRDLGPGPAPDARAFLERVAEHLTASAKRDRRAGVGPQSNDDGPSAG
jgi:hypothetical protein